VGKFEQFREEVAAAVRTALAGLGAEADMTLEKPPSGLADLAFPCFPLARKLRKSPDLIAKDLATRMRPGGMVERIEAKGGYVNFFVSFPSMAQSVLEDALSMKERYGAGTPKEVRILLEHTSVNPTGPIHVGRARNPIIGDTLARILRHAGYEVTTEFYVNDVGRQVVVMAWGVKHLKLEAEPERDRDDYRYVLYYQQANKLLDEKPEIVKEVDEMLYRLEHGDPETVALAKGTCETVLRAIMESLKKINIDVDRFTFESRFVQDGSVDRVIQKLKESEYSREEEGAHHLELESFGISGRETKWVFTRSDGTSLYTTRDLAYHMDKFTRTDEAINVLGEDQKLGMQELAAALTIMGVEKKPEVVYYAFVSLPEGRMSTRRGRVVNLDDLVDEAVELAYEEVKKRRTDLSEERMRAIATVVGIGALRFNIARIQPEKQIVFKWEDALNFEGSSAPFVQYSHARACSILAKAGDWNRIPDAKMLVSDSEKALLKKVAELGSVVQDSAEGRRPNMLAVYAQDLAAEFNQFYRYMPVLKAEGATRDARLALVEASMWALRNTLNVLGLEAPEEM